MANTLRLMLTWDLTIFGNTIGNKDRGEVIPRTWFHSFFSRKESEIRIAFTFFEKWKVKNKIPSLFFEKWKWNWNGSRSRTRNENEKKILEKRESRWSLTHWLTQWVSEWQGHLLSCPGQLKIFHLLPPKDQILCASFWFDVKILHCA